jgi:hypothetical protein
MEQIDYSKKVRAAKKYLGERYCLHPRNRVKRLTNVKPPLWKRVAHYLDVVETPAAV